MFMVIKCPKCGSENVQSEKGMRRTGAPKGKDMEEAQSKMKFRIPKHALVSWGYFYMKNYCLECSEVWEDKI